VKQRNLRKYSKEGNDMYCNICGKELVDGRCKNCSDQGLKGFSNKIYDPVFDKYIKNTKVYGRIFALVLSLILIIGFYVYGEIHPGMDNPQAVAIGLVIGLIYTVSVFLFASKRNKGHTWDGIVANKTEKVRQKHQKGQTPTRVTEYTVFIKGDNGEELEKTNENTMKVYNYYQIGDRVRFHGKLGTIEKFDKSKDSIIFCNACSTINDISSDYCFRCKCPLLK
jgi:hypothetical protein